MQLTLIDSTVLLRLILGEPGAEFAVNLLARAEQGLESILVTLDAVREALEAGTYAAASSMLDSSDPTVLAEKIGVDTIRAQAYRAVKPLLDYLARLHAAGHLQVYTASLQDLEKAYQAALEKQIPLRDALTLHVAEKMGVQRIASFSPAVRRHAPRNTTVIPSL